MESSRYTWSKYEIIHLSGLIFFRKLLALSLGIHPVDDFEAIFAL